LVLNVWLLGRSGASTIESEKSAIDKFGSLVISTGISVSLAKISLGLSRRFCSSNSLMAVIPALKAASISCPSIKAV